MMRYVLVLLLLLESLVLPASAGTKAFFTVIDDDATSVASVSSMKKVADDNDVKVCFAVIANRIVANRELTDTLLKYTDEGFQILNHSLTHSRQLWSEGDSASVRDDVVRAQFTLDSMGFVNHEYLVYPYGRFTPERREMLRRVLSPMVRLAFNSRGCGNSHHGFDRFYISRMPVRKHENLSIVHHEIDQVADAGGWLVLMTHSGNSRDFSEEYISEIIGYCLSKGMECVTVEQAWQMIGSIPDTPDRSVIHPTVEMFDAVYKHLWYILGFTVVCMCVLMLVWHFKQSGLKKHGTSC